MALVSEMIVEARITPHELARPALRANGSRALSGGGQGDGGSEHDRRVHLISTSSAAACVTGTPTAVGPAPTCMQADVALNQRCILQQWVSASGMCCVQVESRRTAIVHTDTRRIRIGSTRFC